ncbi:hypothetical protein MGLY_35110 (plasmid) [Neomoorella glycerini]|uniref:Uncharacterized protein n=1 Tax=Neomoorella glycerini TaxID=55779 RepID=A0A6I5ZWD8_9FIRM|nr:hypothetical protein [Moorella glycerini]QGP94086.1 hypothetical protein MGLY_35110 [Moorella glycerini]
MAKIKKYSRGLALILFLSLLLPMPGKAVAAPAKIWVTLQGIKDLNGNPTGDRNVYGYFYYGDREDLFIECDPSTGKETRAYVLKKTSRTEQAQELAGYQETQYEDTNRWREVWAPQIKNGFTPRSFSWLIQFTPNPTLFYVPFFPVAEDLKLAFPIAGADFMDATPNGRYGWNPYYGAYPLYSAVSVGSYPVKINLIANTTVDGYSPGYYRVNQNITVPGGLPGYYWWQSFSANAAAVNYYFTYRRDYWPYYDGNNHDEATLYLYYQVLSVGDPEAPEWAKTNAANNRNGASWGAGYGYDHWYATAPNQFYARYSLNGYYASYIITHVNPRGYQYGHEINWPYSGYYYGDTSIAVIKGPVFDTGADLVRWVPALGVDSGNSDIQYGAFAVDKSNLGYRIANDSLRQVDAWVDFGNRTFFVANRDSSHVVQVPASLDIRWGGLGYRGVSWSGTVFLNPGEIKAAYIWPDNYPNTAKYNDEYSVVHINCYNPTYYFPGLQGGEAMIGESRYTRWATGTYPLSRFEPRNLYNGSYLWAPHWVTTWGWWVSYYTAYGAWSP